MAVTLSLHDWLKLTDGGFTKPRSKELKAIDEALKTYHVAAAPAALSSLQGALLRWMQKEGQNWKASIRNKHNAVDTLYKQAAGMPMVAKTGAGMVAISHARDESRAIVTELFKGKSLRYRSGLLTKLAGNGNFGKIAVSRNLGGLAQNAAGSIRSAAGQGGGKTSDAANLAGRLFRELVPLEIVGEATMAVQKAMPDFMNQWIASLTPWSGVITSAGGVVLSSATTLRAEWRVYDANVHAKRTMSADEPEKALEALVRLLERERSSQRTGLAVGVADFGGKLAGVLADGGTATTVAVGLASGVAKLALMIRAIVCDIIEKNAANKVMAQPTVGTKLFEACPVMGAYLICCAPTSVLVNTIFDHDSFYQHGMQDKVERAVKRHVEPVREQARRLVSEHRMYIPELMNYPGVLAVNKKKLKEMMERKGKTTIGLDHFGSDDV